MKTISWITAFVMAYLVIPVPENAYAGDGCVNGCLVLLTACRLRCSSVASDCEDKCDVYDTASSRRTCKNRCSSDQSSCNSTCQMVFNGCTKLCD